MHGQLKPKLFTVLRTGYSREQFLADLGAGVIVGVVALPLAIAFAIASGVKPEQGLYTAVIAGPTGAFIVIVFGIVQKQRPSPVQGGKPLDRRGMREATGITATRGRSVLAGILLATSVAVAGVPDGSPGVINAGSRTEKRIALTFDACATRAPSRVDRGVIDVLVETQTRATFFLGGKWMTDHPSETRLLASLPQFELGNHSYLHPHMPMLDGTGIAKELRRTQEILRSLTGRTARWFRPPYGEWSAAVVETAAVLGLRTVMYDLASGDPDSQATSDRLIEYVVRKARNGSIVVMHANGRGWHTAEALPVIISRLRARGFELVTIGELLENKRSGEHGNPGTEGRP